MSIKKSFTSRGKSILTIRVTSYENCCLQGYVSTDQEERGQAFCSGIQMLLMVDAFMNSVNTPQRNEEQRRFVSQNECFSMKNDWSENLEDISPIATFHMDVMFRQHTTWQGSLIWEEAEQEACFRSVLELICLMHDALTASEELTEK